MRRTILVPLLIFLALAAIGGAVAFWIYDSYNYYRTDDAQVSGKIVSVSAPIAGTLTSLNVKSGAQVSAGQTIGSITPVSITSTPGTGGTSGSSAALDLTSPINGTVLQVPAVQGQNVAPGQFSLLPNQDPTSGNFTKVGQRIPVVISLDANSGKIIMPGMSAEVTIHIH